jgi:VWFA-related protein
MKRTLSLGLSGLSGLAFCLIAGAQEPKAVQQDEQPLFRSETRLVVLHATVTDKSGRRLNNLAKNAFEVYENGVQQDIKVFRREDVPVSMGIVVDASASMRDRRASVEAAAMALVKASNAEDEVFVMNFNDEVYLDQDFTQNHTLMEQGLKRGADVRGGTAMRDAIDLAIRHMKAKARRDKKVLLVISDGEDNSSRYATIGGLLADAQESGIQVHTIGLLSEEDTKAAKRARRELDAITTATGGQPFYPKDVADVGRIAEQVAHDVRNQYTLAYTPTNGVLDGTYREVKVIALAPNNPVVRTRSGYYAGRPQTARLD